MFRIIHTSDWHLGKTFFGLSLIEDQRFALSQLINYVQAHEIDVVVVAGDIFDRAVAPIEALALFEETLLRLTSNQRTHVFLISGNHDSTERLGFGSDFFSKSRIHIVTQFEADLRKNCLILEKTTGNNKERLEIFGIPFEDSVLAEPQPHDSAPRFEGAEELLVRRVNSCLAHSKNLSENSDMDHSSVDAVFRIAVSHAFVLGGDSSDSERPLARGTLSCVSPHIFEGFDYVALGHLHSPQAMLDGKVCYAGSLLKYSFGETAHKKGFRLIELGKRETGVDSCFVPLEPLRDVRIVEGLLVDIIREARSDPQASDYVLARVTDKKLVLDVMGQLRQVYPHVLHVERPFFEYVPGQQNQVFVNRSVSEEQFFCDFYRHVTGSDQPTPDHLLSAFKEVFAEASECKTF